MIEKLQSRIAELEHKKHSKNSSLPPSKDNNRKTKSLRKKSVKKTGGQLGHKGTTLNKYEKVDEVIDHDPQYCQCCGEGFSSDSERKLHSTRQVVDIPPIEPVVTEHRSYERHCQKCGHLNRGAYPKGVNSPISYGKNISTLVSYFSASHYISQNRIKQIMSDIFQISMSEGTVVNKIKSFAKSCEWVYEQIRQRILQSKWTGTDETGYRLNGKKAWMWTWQNNEYTLLYASENRGIDTIKQVFPEGLKKSIMVHDCWKSHFNTECVMHQLCLAHLQRELIYFIEKRTDKWAYQMNQVLSKAMKLKRIMLTNTDKDYSKAIVHIETKLSKLIHVTQWSSNKKLKSFQKRMKKYKEYILPFLHYPFLPYDNNSSERAIRNMKVKMKVSGMFKTRQGAQEFAIIRSVIDTCIKNNRNIFKALSLIPE